MSVYVENLNRSAYQYQLAAHERFNEICEPLFKLGIKYFGYGVFFEAGEYLNISNNKEYIKYHYLNMKCLGDIWLKVISEVQDKSYFLVPYHMKDEDPLINFAAYLGVWNLFAIYKRKPNCFIVYYFGTDTNDPLFSQFYFKNLYLLEHFCDYFDEKAKDIVDCTDKTKLGFLEFPRPFFNPCQEDIFHKKVQCFLQETFIGKKILRTQAQDVFLSKRELECLQYLSLGKTTKEIARSLDLSPRSVEFYLQNIKKKSGLKRGELITHFVHNFADP